MLPFSLKTILLVLLVTVVVGVVPVQAKETHAADDPQTMALLAEAKAGEPGAQYLLGFMYAEGQGLKQDFSEAVKWYTKAANQGHAGAQLMLGMMYGEGRAVKKDDRKAVKWYTKAAQQGNAGVQLMLAAMVAEGRGAGTDRVEACKWMLLAEKNGEDVAADKTALMAQMTEKQIAEAQKRAEDFMNKYPEAVSVPQKVTSAGVYASDSDGFSIWFPSLPRKTEVRDSSALRGAYYQSFSTDGAQYNVSFRYCKDPSAPARQSQRKLLDDYLIGRAMYAQDNEVRKKYMKFKGYNAARFRHRTHSGGVESVHEGVVFLMKSHFVTLTCVYPSSLTPSPTLEEFIGSFELAAAESASQ